MELILSLLRKVGHKVAILWFLRALHHFWFMEASFCLVYLL